MNTAEKARQFAKALVTRKLDFKYWGMPCHIENIPLKKLLNLAHFQINTARSRPGRPWYPIQLHIETSGACSLHCPLCPAGMGLIEIPRKIMPFPVFRALMDEVGDYALYTLMWRWGEPLLNPKLPDMIEYAHAKRVVTFVSTNGQHLETKEDAERLVSSGLDCLIVSMDGATQETYSQYRVGGDVRKIIRCLELVKQAKDALGTARPIVNVQTVVLKQNEHELADIEEIARKSGADMVSRVSSHIPDYAGSDLDERYAPSDPRYQRFEYQDGKRVRRSIQKHKCVRPWERMTVSWDGTITACEHDYNESAPFGIGGAGRSFIEAWRSAQADSFRRQFLKDKSVYTFCADCHYRDNKQECMVDLVHLGEAA